MGNRFLIARNIRSIGIFALHLAFLSSAPASAAGYQSDHPTKVGNVVFDIEIADMETKMTSADFGDEHEGTTSVSKNSSTKLANCPKAPATTELANSVRKVFQMRSVTAAYEAIRANSVTILTVPKITDLRARLYLYTSRLDNCPGKNCLITAKANLLIVPVSDDSSTILMSKAQYKNDEVSGEAIDAADRVATACKL